MMDGIFEMPTVQEFIWVTWPQNAHYVVAERAGLNTKLTSKRLTTPIAASLPRSLACLRRAASHYVTACSTEFDHPTQALDASPANASPDHPQPTRHQITADSPRLSRLSSQPFSRLIQDRSSATMPPASDPLSEARQLIVRGPPSL